MPVTNITDSLIQYHMKLEETETSKVKKSKQLN